MKIFCYAAGKTSLYIPLLYSSIKAQFQPETGVAAHPRHALKALREGEDVIIHIHWEEFVLQKATTPEAARTLSLLFQEQMRAFRRAGGRIFWTIHNILPHRVPHVAQFLEIRRFLADIVDGILVHNVSAIPILQAQFDLPIEKVCVLPHPAYTGLYEDEAVAEAAVGSAAGRTLLCFGSVRLQKNIGGFIDMLPAAFLAEQQACIRVSGTGPEAEAVQSQHAHRSDVIWDLRYIPMTEAPALMRSAACVVLPYESFLTSGVALLVLSIGGLLVAADAPQFREILPAPSHRFLYTPGDSMHLQQVIRAVLTLSLAERAEICRANFDAARRYAPAKIGAQLGSYYSSFGIDGLR